jgi:hypothetical protein
MRREYSINSILVNDISINRVIIDDHVDKHSDHIDDLVILRIVSNLNGQQFEEGAIRKNGYSYFATAIEDDGNWYKLIWLLEDNCFYIGVITLFRDRRI